MSKLRTRLYLLIAMLFSILPTTGTHAQNDGTSYRVETARWRSAEGNFAGWQRVGVALASGGVLQLDAPRSSGAGATDSHGPGRRARVSTLMGEATGPVVTTSFSFSEAVPSWNAITPNGTWIEVLLRARTTSGWSRWYNLGVWRSGPDEAMRHSVEGQADADGYVDVDTLKLGERGKPLTATAYQLKFRLFSKSREALPSVTNAAVVVSTSPRTPPVLAPGNPARWDKVLPVPECSQMVYPDGGEVWCSPTSVSMVLGYWAGRSGSCEPGVRAAVTGVYDRVYEGHGNWPFNAAYAAGQGMEAYVTRFTSMAQAEEWVAAGVPVVMSYSWGRGQLSGAPIAASNGHLAVLVGFDALGNPVVNDPAAASNEAVQRTYPRAELERLWLQGSGGTVYLIYPAGRTVPGL
ncbi:MAG: peptidase C39 family protein [Chloroflexota bacterium]|nr:peptidase C39 family protein [Chloroflexota bacterium]